MSGSDQLRALLSESRITIVPGVYDGISARLVEQMSFETGFLSGAGVSNSRMAQPDMGVLNLTEIAAHTKSITDVVEMPVWVDADTGYGNAVNVYHTVKRLADAGAASVMIEDQEWPKRCGHMAGKSVIPGDEAAAKIEAAVTASEESATDPLVMARTDAAGPQGMEEAIQRLNTFADRGAEIVFADALETKKEIQQVCEEVDDAAVCVNMGFGIRSRPTTPLIPAPELEELGVDAVIYPRLITAAATMGMKRGLEALEDATETDEEVEHPNLVVDWDYYTDLMGQAEFDALEDRFATDDD